MTGPVLRDLTDGVGTISFNRPDKHNALDDAASAAFREAVAWALHDDAVRCILIRGEGRSFSSGRDTSQLGQRDEGMSDRDYIARAQAGKRPLLHCAKPVVAALRGYCLGGAFETALMADIRVAADDLQAGLPEVRLGLVPDTGGTQLLADLIGPARAKYMILTGRRIDAAQALAWGLVELVVAPEELDACARELAVQLAAAAPLAVGHAKALIDAARRDRFDRTLQHELDAQVELFKSADHAEARAAAREKRPPRYSGS